MRDDTIQRINVISFIAALSTIAAGVVIASLGVWGVISRENDLLWRILGTDGILFAGAVLTNLAIACYRKPGGAVA
jgi:hypothetical protein